EVSESPVLLGQLVRQGRRIGLSSEARRMVISRFVFGGQREATMIYEGMIAETIAIAGDQNETISAYVARPLGPGPFPGIVLIHHAPGWDEWYYEATRRFAHHGYAAICHNLYH